MSTQIVIRVENLSKQYRLGTVGTGTLAHDLNRMWHKVRGKEDPFLKVGEENDRSEKGESEYIWALKDISFEVKKGEVLGMIGRNGAGKSTLLKILSRTTAPTTGSVKIKGRIASLLEVGTGFHPELSGRENIFLNGAILGMRKHEITKKFDEIVDFAGVERYIDTPVKRYSSGMYVRLAFAVAAYLESEILIVDEVLAVGDAEFQKKCLGKMGEVSKGEGRTVLFVSHNMVAIRNLCKLVMYLQNGKMIDVGNTAEVLHKYLSNTSLNNVLVKYFPEPENAPGNEFVKIKRLEICPVLKNGVSLIDIETEINIEFEFWNYITDKDINLSLSLYAQNDECVFASVTALKKLSAGLQKAICEIPSNLLNDGMYQISVMIVCESKAVYNYENEVNFEINENRLESGWHGKWPGAVRPKLNFNFY